VVQRIEVPLMWHPLVPGSAQHLALIARTAPVTREAARRASRIHAAAVARVTPDKAEAPGLQSEGFTAPRSTANGFEDGCSTECA
jgi:hypothetical protein